MPSLWAEKYAAWREQHPGADVTALRRPDGRYRMAVLGGEATERHKYGCLLAIMPADVAEKVRLVAASIDPGDLAADGIELEPHITVLYGFHDESPEQVSHVLRDEGPVAVMLGETRCFEGSDQDVVYVAVESNGLHDAHQLVSDACPHTSKFREYIPHLTIAYVQPGKGQKYCGMRHLDRWIVGVDKLVYSSPSKVRSTIPLAGVVRFGQRLAWSQYEGPRHGHGWKNSETGDVVYQQEKPQEKVKGKELQKPDNWIDKKEIATGKRVTLDGGKSGEIVDVESYEDGGISSISIKTDDGDVVKKWSTTGIYPEGARTHNEFYRESAAEGQKEKDRLKAYIDALPEMELSPRPDNEQPSEDAVKWWHGESDQSQKYMRRWMSGNWGEDDTFCGVVRKSQAGLLERPYESSDEEAAKYAAMIDGFSKTLTSSFDRSPRYAGKIYRGVGLKAGDNTEFLQSLKPGMLIDLAADSSATKSQETAGNFAKAGGAYVNSRAEGINPDLMLTFEVDTKSGVDLSMVNPDEQEVILRRGGYRVKGVGRSKDGGVIVKLEDAGEDESHNPLTDIAVQ